MTRAIKFLCGLLMFVADPSGFVGTAPGSPTVPTIQIRDFDAAPSSGDFFVNPFTSMCDDGYTGLSRTFTSDLTGPWCNPNRCNAMILQSGSTPRTCWIETGTYTSNNVLDFANSGLSAAAPLRACAIGGDVTLRNGGTPGTWIFRQRTNRTQIGGCDTNRIIGDGEVDFGNGVLVRKGEAPEAVANIQGVEISGDDNVLDVDLMRTGGWKGITLRRGAERNVLRVNHTQHGTPYYPDGDDFGDSIWVEESVTTEPILFDGGSTGREWSVGGHSIYHARGGRVLLRGIAGMNSWGGIATFSNVTPDGNRGFENTRNSADSQHHDFVINRSGRSQDQIWVECLKTQGTRSAWIVFVARNCLGWAILGDAAHWSWHTRGVRVAHAVFDNLGGPVALYSDYGDGQSSLSDIQYKNIIVDDFWQQPTCCRSEPWTNDLYVFNLTGSETLQSIGFVLDGATIKHASGSCDNVFITVYGGANSGKRSLPQWNAIYPNNIKNYTCATSVNLSNAPAAATNIAATAIESAYRPVNDWLSTGTGSALTSATTSGVNSNTLTVADVTWFPDPQPDASTSWGAPSLGQWNGNYTVHIQGVGNVAFTNRTLPNPGVSTVGTLTLAVSQTWSSGANVNLKISTGGANDLPNRGAAL